MSDTLQFIEMQCNFHKMPLIFKCSTDNLLLCEQCIQEKKIPREGLQRVDVVSVAKSDIANRIEILEKEITRWDNMPINETIKLITDNLYTKLHSASEDNWKLYVSSINNFKDELKLIDKEYNSLVSSIRIKAPETNSENMSALESKMGKLQNEMAKQTYSGREAFSTIAHQLLDNEIDSIFPKVPIADISKAHPALKRKKTDNMNAKKVCVIESDETSNNQQVKNTSDKKIDNEETVEIQVVDRQSEHSTPEMSYFTENIIESNECFIIQNCVFNVNDPLGLISIIYSRLASLNPKKLHLKNVIFNGSMFIAFMTFLSEYKSIKMLKCKNMRIKQDNILSLYEYLPQTNIEYLAFTNCSLLMLKSMKPGKFWEIIERDYPQLKKLKYRSCELLDYMCISLKDSLKKNSHLESLDISNNQLSYIGLKDLFPTNTKSIYKIKQIILKNIDKATLSRFPIAATLIKY